jgi:hypothetical protein
LRPRSGLRPESALPTRGGGNTAGCTRSFENGGSAPAYQDAPEFAKFMEADSARLIAVTRRIGRVE